MVDIGDLKSPADNSVWVRVPPRAHIKNQHTGADFLYVAESDCLVAVTCGARKAQSSFFSRKNRRAKAMKFYF